MLTESRAKLILSYSAPKPATNHGGSAGVRRSMRSRTWLVLKRSPSTSKSDSWITAKVAARSASASRRLERKRIGGAPTRAMSADAGRLATEGIGVEIGPEEARKPPTTTPPVGPGGIGVGPRETGGS